MEYITGSYLKEEGFILVQSLRVEFIMVWKLVLCDHFLLIGTLPSAGKRQLRTLKGLRNFKKVTRPTGLLPEVA